MNRVVREHYPAAKLPEDLRAEIGDIEAVRVVIEPEGLAAPSIREILEEAKRLRAAGIIPVTSDDDAVARVRKLRDEWER